MRVGILIKNEHALRYVSSGLIDRQVLNFWQVPEKVGGKSGVFRVYKTLY